MAQRLRILCGLLALAISVLILQASSAQSRPASCGARLVQVGPVFAAGCWHQTAGSQWRAATPVTLDGLKLTGGATIAVDTRAGTIASSRSVRWLIGSVQIRKAPFAWRLKAPPLAFSATGAVRGLKFGGTAKLSFNGSDGGTTRLAAKLVVPVSGGVAGDAVLNVSLRHGFNPQKVHVTVGQLAVGRLFFRQLDFAYARNLWSATVGVRLPAFSASAPTVTGHVEIANGALKDVAVSGSGLTVPLGEGFVLTKAGLDLGLGPLVIQGTGTAIYGPPVAGGGPLEIDGRLQYSSQPEQWEAHGTVSLPWGIPGVKPRVDVGLQVDAGHAMGFTSDLDLTVHGIGLTGHLDGFASAHAFNAEGRGALKFPVGKLGGTSLVSSRGMSACGSLDLWVHTIRLGFGLRWGAAPTFMGSSCDVGRFRVPVLFRAGRALTPTTVNVGSLAEFAVFAAQGDDFTVAGPTGTFSTTPDHYDDRSFTFHDTTTGITYLAMPVLQAAADYTVTSQSGNPLQALTVASGLPSHADDISGFVDTTGPTPVLHYFVPAATLQITGETVAFYQGTSQAIAGAAPITPEVTTSGVSTIIPEPLGPTQRFVVAVVSFDGLPREMVPIAGFTATPLAPPSAAVFMQKAAGGGWTILFGKAQRVVTWQVHTIAADGSEQWQEVPGTQTTYTVPASVGIPATITVIPVDQFGRDGPTYTCDTGKPAGCPAG